MTSCQAAPFCSCISLLFSPLSLLQSCNMVKLTPTKMGRASEMRKQGKSYRFIAEELKTSYEAVRLRLLAATQRGDLYPRSPPGRRPMLDRSHRHILLSLLHDPYQSFHEIRLPHSVSPTTVRKVASTHCLYRFVSKVKPLLTMRARLDRFKWTSEVADQDWTSVIFTDESMVKVGDKGRR